MCGVSLIKRLKILPMYDIERIKYKLRKKGSSLSVIARNLNVSPAAVTLTLQGRRRSKRIVQAVGDIYFALYELPLPLLDQNLAA